jgi:hypothetical protein
VLGVALLGTTVLGGDRETVLAPLAVEEYDVKRQAQVGNFPQAFGHLTLIGAATAIAAAEAKRVAA